MHEAIFGDVATADDPFARLFAETALPALRSAIVNQWEPRDPEPLLLCLEAFAPVLPPAIRTTLLVRSRPVVACAACVDYTLTRFIRAAGLERAAEADRRSGCVGPAH